jgi:hypothetical protein
MRSRLIGLALVLCTGCGFEGRGPQKFEGVEPHVRADERLIEAQGQWMFLRRLRGLNSHEHFVISTMFQEERGSFTLHSHFNGFAWRDGVRLRFTRDGQHLKLGVTAPDVMEQTFALPDDWLAPGGRLVLRVEVHNVTPAGPRILIWKYTQSWQGEHERPRPFLSAANADFDSAAKGLIFLAHGRGVRWGVEFDHVRVEKMFGEAPDVP